MNFFIYLFLLTGLTAAGTLDARTLYLWETGEDKGLFSLIFRDIRLAYHQLDIIKGTPHAVQTDDLDKKPANANLQTNEPPIVITMGLEAAKSAIHLKQSIDIATRLTESDIYWLQNNYPEILKKTSFVPAYSLIECQLQQAEKIRLQTSGDFTLGVMLGVNSMNLLSLVKKWSKKQNISIRFMLINAIDNPARAFHYLLPHVSAVVLVADKQLYTSTNLQAMLTEARMLNTKTIGFSKEQVAIGTNNSCDINKNNLSHKVIQVIGEILNQLPRQTIAIPQTNSYP